MTDISVERIMRNIYGTSATGQITNMTGGSAIPKLSSNHYGMERPTPNIQYVDINESMSQQFQFNDISAASMTGGMIGGAGKKGKSKKTQRRRNTRKSKAASNENITIYASAEYIPDNSDLHTFIDKFFMYYRMSRSPNSAIYLIPATKTLKEMVAKRGNHPEGSIEMQNAVRTNDKLEYERYLFVTFGNNSKNDRYRIDTELTSKSAYPNSSFGTIRRTNLRGEVYYMTCDANMKVKIHTKPDNANAGSEIKFVGRFNNGGYVFQGDLPGPANEKISPKKEKACKHNNVNRMKFGESLTKFRTMTGGAVNTTLKLLEKYDNLYNGDHDAAAEHFIRHAVKQGKFSEKYRNNGDLLYSAIYFAMAEPTALNGVPDASAEEDKDFSNSFKIINRGEQFRRKVNNVVQQLNKVYKRSMKNNSSKDFIESYKKIYSTNDIAKMTADVATSFLRNNDNMLEAKSINEIYESFSSPAKASVGVCSLIKNSLNSGPLPSAFGSEFIPILGKMNSFESDMKSNKYKKNVEDTPGADAEAEASNTAAEMFAAAPKDKAANETKNETAPASVDTTNNVDVDDVIESSDAFQELDSEVQSLEAFY